MVTWMGERADLEPVAGGRFAVDINGVPFRGEYLEVDPPHRVVVSWGMADSADLPPGSSTYTNYLGVELTAESGRALYVPGGMAHGFVTLDDDCEVSYQMSEYFEPSAARGVRWNDPAFGISWPLNDPILHPRDAAYPDFVKEEGN